MVEEKARAFLSFPFLFLLLLLCVCVCVFLLISRKKKRDPDTSDIPHLPQFSQICAFQIVSLRESSLWNWVPVSFWAGDGQVGVVERMRTSGGSVPPSRV